MDKIRKAAGSGAGGGPSPRIRPSEAPTIRRLHWSLGRLVSRERDGVIQGLDARWSLPGDPPDEPLGDPLLERVRRQLTPDLTTEVPWDCLALDPLTSFQRRVLRAAAGVPAGSTRTYGQLARDVGSPGGARAVGQALKRNPFAPLVPCHRILRADGAIGGYKGRSNETIKRGLLDLERRAQ